MRIAFFTNFINHHQVHVADYLYHMPGIDYVFVETEQMPESFIKAGYPDYSTRPYVLKAYASSKLDQQALKLANQADVVIIGSAPEKYVTERINKNKLTFRYSERWFKSKPWYLSGPRAWWNFYKNHIRYKNKPLYMLAASAYTANDVYAIGAYKNKVFKWGYFTKVSIDSSIESINLKSTDEKSIQIMWCARFLKWKHPELPVMLAKRLKEQGYDIQIDMYGSGVEYDAIYKLINNLEVGDVVKLRGNIPNNRILQQMQKHHLFLFTSDQNEGWGAVLNEAMSSGCAVVASNKIGAVPFLIEDGKNGLIFESENLDSLEQAIKRLLDDKELRQKLSIAGRKTVEEIWSPQNAAKQLLTLMKALQSKDDSLIPLFGPCSKTYPCHI